MADLDLNRHTSTKQLTIDHQISRQSVRRIAASAGFRSNKEQLVPDIRPADEEARLDWAVQHARINPRDFVYTDKCGFTIGDHSQDTYVFWKPQEVLDANKTHARKPHYRQVMLWGAISYNFKSALFIIPKNTPTPIIDPPPRSRTPNPNGSTLNQVKYAVCIIEQRLVPALTRLRIEFGRQPVVIEDGCASHDGEVAERYRQRWGMRQFQHPAHSPDLNAIENIWSVLKRAVEARRPKATRRDELICHILEEWDSISMDVVKAACMSIKDREQEVWANAGYATGH